MKTKKTYLLLQIVFLVTLFVAAVALGVTGAYYRFKNEGTGAVVFNKGLHYTIYNLSVNSNGDLISDGNILYYTDGMSATTYSAFKNISIGQTETYQIATPYVKSKSTTLPFYLRAKLEFVMWADAKSTTKIENTTAIANLTAALFNNGTNIAFDSSWTEAGGWHYYVDSSLNLKEVNGSSEDILILAGTKAASNNYYSTFKTGEWDALTGGPETTVGGATYKLAKLDIKLTIESIQVEGADAWGYSA